MLLFFADSLFLLNTTIHSIRARFMALRYRSILLSCIKAVTPLPQSNYVLLACFVSCIVNVNRRSIFVLLHYISCSIFTKKINTKQQNTSQRMNVNHADTRSFITHALPLRSVFIIAHLVSVVQDFRQNPPNLPCFKHQALGAAAQAAASASAPPLSKEFSCCELPIFSSVKR